MSEPQFLNRPSLNGAGASTLLDQAISAALRDAVEVAVAVVDASGNLMRFVRMDGAPPVSSDVAVGKARTAAVIASPSETFETMINDGATAMLSVPGLFPLKGGIPIVISGQIAGAIGVSGSTGENDREIALRAISAFEEMAAGSETPDVA